MENALVRVEEADLAASAPKSVANFTDCLQAVSWLRVKKQFDAAVDAAHKEAIALAHRSHKAALKVAAELKGPSDSIRDQVRAMVEAYAENPASELPPGVFRRKAYRITVVKAEEVPVMFLKPDMKLIEDFVKRTEGSVKIAGVEVVPETAITVREEDNG